MASLLFMPDTVPLERGMSMAFDLAKLMYLESPDNELK